MKTIKRARLTETGGRQLLRLLVLVPHPEIRHKMRLWSDELFKAGLAGAWSFPHVAPLAVLSDFLSPLKLKQCAALLRSHQSDDGKIKCGPPRFSALPPVNTGDNSPGGAHSNIMIYGPELDMDIPCTALSEVCGTAPRWFSLPVLGAALATEADGGVLGEAASRIQPPALAFRAAALANMIFKPLPGVHNGGAYSYAWKIGSLHWLPSGGTRVPPGQAPFRNMER